MKYAINYRPQNPPNHPLRGRMGYCDIEQIVVEVSNPSDLEKYLKALRNDHGHDCIVTKFYIEG